MSTVTTQHFRITVKGKVDPSWSDWFNGMVIVSGSEPDGSHITILTGVIKDQAALRGLLTRLWDLNLSLISIQPIEPREIDGTMRVQGRPPTRRADHSERDH